jgi:putative hydrolase of the HAD superfamily
MPIKVIAFDADDTLWVNEPYFRETEEKFCALLEDYLPRHTIMQELFKTEMQNLSLYGYGIKGFVLSMIETAMRISDNKVSMPVIEKIIQYGKEQLERPIELLEGMEEALHLLKKKYRLVIATKGDLLDQDRKLKKSGIEHYFHHIEIMSDKQLADYQKLIRHLDITSDEFLMIGNSLKSDSMPVLAIGGHAVHIPYHVTWEHEKLEQPINHPNFRQVETIKQILPELLL